MAVRDRWIAAHLLCSIIMIISVVIYGIRSDYVKKFDRQSWYAYPVGRTSNIYTFHIYNPFVLNCTLISPDTLPLRSYAIDYHRSTNTCTLRFCTEMSCEIEIPFIIMMINMSLFAISTIMAYFYKFETPAALPIHQEGHPVVLIDIDDHPVEGQAS